VVRSELTDEPSLGPRRLSLASERRWTEPTVPLPPDLGALGALCGEDRQGNVIFKFRSSCCVVSVPPWRRFFRGVPL